MANEKNKMGQARYDELKAELEYLQTDGERQVAEQIKEARSFGDLSENSEYDAAKNEQAKLYARIAELKEIIENAEIIAESNTSGRSIGMGSKVTVLDVEFEEEETYKIVGSQEANPMENRISDESPLGRALLGADIGDVIVVEAPAGKITYKILSMEN